MQTHTSKFQQFPKTFVFHAVTQTPPKITEPEEIIRQFDQKTNYATHESRYKIFNFFHSTAMLHLQKLTLLIQ